MKSIRSIILILATYFIFACLFMFFVKQQLDQEVRQAAKDTAALAIQESLATFRQEINGLLIRQDIDQLNQTLKEKADASQIIKQYRLFDPKMVLLASSREASAAPGILDEQIQSQLKKTPWTNQIVQSNDNTFQVYVPIGQNTQYVLESVIERKPVTEIQDELATYLIFSLLGGLIIALSVIIFQNVKLNKLFDQISLFIDASATRSTTAAMRKDLENTNGVVDATDRFSHRLDNAQQLVQLFQREMDKMAERLNAGLLIYDQELENTYLSHSAKNLLTNNDTQRYSEIADDVHQEIIHYVKQVKTAFDRNALKQTYQFSVQRILLNSSRDLEVEIYPTQLENQQHPMYIVLIQDKDHRDALTRDLSLATKTRNITRLYVGIVHDLRSPLNTISANVQLISQQLADIEQPDKHIEPVENSLILIKDALYKLDHIVSFTLEQIFEDQNTTMKTIDVVEMIKQIKENISTQAKANNIMVKMVFNKGKHYRIEGNIQQLRQALLNIMINAMDAVRNNGNIWIDITQEAHYVCIAIEDSGQGIAEELRNKVFDLHFSTKDYGTGIGLYITKTIINQHEGALWIANPQYGQGARFMVRLPLALNDPDQTKDWKAVIEQDTAG